MDLTFDEFYSFTSTITQEASEIITSRNLSGIETSRKSDGTIVTDADLRIERLLRSRIDEKFPLHSIVGEEYPDKKKSSPYTWIIDPIDGTTSYYFGVPFYGTLIGLLKNGKPQFGSMRLPMFDKMLAGDGSQCLINGNKTQVKKFNGFENSLVLTSDEIRMSDSAYNKSWNDLRETDATFRTWGDCYGYYLVCTGKADAMIDLDLKPCDILPIIPIAEGAGAKVIDFGAIPYCDISICIPELAEKVTKLFAKS
jgi:myo-inositol-1(or 4)-monophosphatase